MKKKILALLNKVKTTKTIDLTILDLLIKKKGVKIVNFLNTNAINLSIKNSKLFKNFLESDLILRDGVGVKIAMFINGLSAGHNMNGTDLIPLILQRYKKRKIYVISSEKKIANKFLKIYKSKFNSLDVNDGFKKFNFYLNKIKSKKPNIILIGMGVPKQEYLSNYIKKNYDKDLLIINGGAVIRFMSNTNYRAPKFIRKLGLEWLFRLILEPKRLFKRYVLGNPIFLFRVIIEKFS